MSSRSGGTVLAGRSEHPVPCIKKHHTKDIIHKLFQYVFGHPEIGLGRWRWVIERTFAWLNQFRRLRLRYEKRADMHKAFLSLACALIYWNFLQGHFP